MEQASLFDEVKYEPLAYRMRPRNLSEFVGQEHLIVNILIWINLPKRGKSII